MILHLLIDRLKSKSAGAALSAGILGYGIYKIFNKDTNESDPIVELEENTFLKPKI